MTRFLPLLVLAAVLAACDIDFTEVTSPPGNGPGEWPLQADARLDVNVRLDDRPLPELRLFARLLPGAIEDGSTRGVSNDTLYLGERALTPGETSEPDQLYYEWLPGPESEPGTLSITAPVVEGLAALPPVRFRGYHRVGPDTLSAAAGDTLRFEIAPDPATAHEPSSTSWSFSLSSPGVGLHRSDTTAVPPIMTVPADWLAWAGTDPVHVRLSVQEIWRRELPDGEYTATIAVSWHMVWTVVWPEAGE